MRASVLLPVYNEQLRIVGCLASLAAQTLPKPDYEIIVADGGSTDATLPLVRGFAEQHPDLNVKIIANPRRTTAAGLNEAIQVATGAILTRVDGHSVVPPNYLEEMEKTLADPAVGAAGAAVVNADPDPEVAALWAAVCSPFGTGGSDYRTPGAVREVASVQGAAYRRDVVEQVGRFDEAMLHAEDEDYNWRVKQAGGKIILRGDLKLGYFPRRTRKELWEQMYNYGRGRVRMLRKYPGYLRWKHLVPPLFVIGFYLNLIAFIVLFIMTSKEKLSVHFVLTWIPFIAYGILAFLASRWAKRMGMAIIETPVMVELLMTIHLSYGRGFLVQLFSRK